MQGLDKMLEQHATTIDPFALRDAVGHYASGVTIISGIDGEGPIGFTCQAFYSVSLEPPLVSFSVMKTSTTYPRIRATGRFAVNILSHHQDSVSNQFARSGTDKWAGISHSRTGSGLPVIDDALAWLDCDIWAEYDAGDHQIVLGQVKEISPAAAPALTREPLLFFQGAYRRLLGH